MPVYTRNQIAAKSSMISHRQPLRRSSRIAAKSNPVALVARAAAAKSSPVVRAAPKSIMVTHLLPRRSTRIARLSWLKRLRPRHAILLQQEPVRIRNSTPVSVKQEQAPVSVKQPPAEETFTMMANPMFFTTAPRSCTGWSCCCAAPHGFGPGRTNWCALYSLEPMPEEPDPFVFPPTAAKTPPLSQLLSLLPPLPKSPVTPHPTPSSPPALSERTMNMVLAQIGVPVKPQSPSADCMTQ